MSITDVHNFIWKTNTLESLYLCNGVHDETEISVYLHILYTVLCHNLFVLLFVLFCVLSMEMKGGGKQWEPYDLCELHNTSFK